MAETTTNPTSNKPSFHILVCLIQIWTPQKGKETDLLAVPDNAMMITECESIEIEDSYQNLINTANVKFPRGTVIRQTISPKDNLDEVLKNSKLDYSVEAGGAVDVVRTEISSVAKVDNFHTGDRIRIYLGYTTDPKIAKMAKASNTDPNSSIFLSAANKSSYLNAKEGSSNVLCKMFDGFISKISVDAPIELSCENFGYILKEKTCKKVTVNGDHTVKQLFSDPKGLNLLKGTGLEISSKTLRWDFSFGKIELNEDLTVADVLTEWNKYGVHAFITEENNKPVIAIGRTYFSNAKEESDSIISAVPGQDAIEIDFAYHVANNGLTLKSTDKKFLAVKAEGLDKDDKFFHFTIRYNPSYDANKKGSEKYIINNETKLSKKQLKAGAKYITKSQDKIDMSTYTIVPYHSRKLHITRDQLVEEATKYLEGYNMNGIEGDITLFGDLHIKTGTKVRLVDKRYPGKNGLYLVDEVHTTFGNGGYRQKIKLPYCISRNNNNGNEQTN